MMCACRVRVRVCVCVCVCVCYVCDDDMYVRVVDRDKRRTFVHITHLYANIEIGMSECMK